MKFNLFLHQFIRVLKLVIVVVPFFGLLYLLYLDVAPSGQLQFTYDFSKDSPAITNLFPANRLTEVNKTVIRPGNQESRQSVYWQAIKTEPVYFEVRLPQKFDRAKVKVVYQNVGQPLIQLGLRTVGESEWNYSFLPLENQLIDKLNWPSVSDERVTLWQRRKTFLSLDQFFDSLNGLEKIGAYYYNIDRKFVLPGYQPRLNKLVLNKSLRGAYAFYTYVKNEALDFTFSVQDINRSEGPDPFTIKVYNSDNVKVYEQQYPDDGYISKYDPASAIQPIKLTIADLPAGAYRVQLEAEDEIITRQIATYQQYLTFIDRLYLIDNPEYSDGLLNLNYQPTVIYNYIPRLGLETAHPEGLQSVRVGEQTLDITETHRSYFITSQTMPNRLYIPANDIKIFGRGLMAFSEEQFFNPEIFRLRDFYGNEGVDYLISSYQSPRSINGWKTNEVSFDLTNAFMSNRKLRLAISAPELNSTGGQIPLKQISVILEKPPLTMPELMVKIYHYFKAKF